MSMTILKPVTVEQEKRLLCLINGTIETLDGYEANHLQKAENLTCANNFAEAAIAASKAAANRYLAERWREMRAVISNPS